MRQLLRCLFALAAAAFCAVAVQAEEIPALQGRVNDYANVLTPAQETALGAQLARIETYEGHPQVVVLTVSTTHDEDIESYSLRVARAWGIGQRDRNNGVLITVLTDPDDFAVRLEVGYGLEGAIPDVRARAIYERKMRPHFQDIGHEDYFTALTDGINALDALIRAESTGDSDIDNAVANARTANQAGVVMLALIVGLFLSFVAGVLNPLASGLVGALAAGIMGVTCSAGVWIIAFVCVGFGTGYLVGLVCRGLSDGSAGWAYDYNASSSDSYWRGGTGYTHSSGGFSSSSGGFGGGFGGGGGSFGGGGFTGRR